MSKIRISELHSESYLDELSKQEAEAVLGANGGQTAQTGLLQLLNTVQGQ